MKYILVFLVLFIPLSIINGNEQNDAHKRVYFDFYILESTVQEGFYVKGDLDQLGYTKYNGEEMPDLFPKHDRMLTLRSTFYVNFKDGKKGLQLIVPPLNYPCQIYLNGDLISQIGDMHFGYTSRTHFSENIFLPPGSLKFDAKNEIAFQLYPKEGEKTPIGKIFLTNAKDAGSYVFTRNLFGPKLIIALSFCSFIFFMFFLFTYLSRGEYKQLQYLFFALMNLLFVLSYINNFITFDYADTFVLEKIARTSFSLFMLSGIFFMLEHTKVFKKKNLIIGILSLIYIPAIIYVHSQDTTVNVIKAYNLYTLPILFLGALFLLVIAVIYFIKSRNKSSIILVVVFFLNLAAGLHDGFYFGILKTKPYLLLTPATVFLINCAIFFLLAIEHSKLYHLSISKTKELKILNENLESIVDERTRQLSENATKLEEANLTKDKFFSIIAHDLRNPFSTLIGFSDLLKHNYSEYSEEEIQEQLDTIYSVSQHGYSLLENLLEWAKTQINLIEFKPSKINLKNIAKECLHENQEQCRLKNIKSLNYVPESIHIHADENLLATVMRNLLNNAFKFTNEGGTIRIDAIENSKDVIVTVKDNGIGISKKEVERIFELENTYSTPGTKSERGSGIGLIICKEFIEMHGGQISVESEQGKGSVFTFSIPKSIKE